MTTLDDDPEAWFEIWGHFDKLVDLPIAEQSEQLANLVIGDRQRAQLERLLDGERRDGILKPDSIPVEHLPSVPVGTMIGKFRVEQLIGRGGAGEVYRANRVRGGFDQRVALKVLRQEAALQPARFAAERALQATLEHPGIARLIDGGATADRRPYMVIELVDGEPITRWCAARQTSLRQRLEIFLEVCDAIAYAHARLIIHCDIKPGNILVSETGHAKLVDFGISRMIDVEEPLAPIETLLTPSYAAPEQFAGQLPTVATDVYSLGAVLFELTAGVPPYPVRPSQLALVLREADSDRSRLPSDAAGAPGAPFPAARLKGDIDAIVLKAMQPGSSDRYATANALADDIRRHLAMEPIAARSHNAGYVFSKVIRRHWIAAAATGFAAISVVAGASGVAWQAHRALVERDAARENAARLQAANEVMLLMFRNVGDDQQLRTMSISDMIRGTTRRVLNSTPTDSPEAVPTIAALADIYLVLENNDEAKALLAGALARGIARNDPPNLARLLLKYGAVLAIKGDFDQADRFISAADRYWQSQPGRFRRERVETAGARALVLRGKGQPLEAAKILQANMPEAEHVFAGDERDLAARYSSLATTFEDAGMLAEADRLLRAAVDRMVQGAGPPPNSALTLMRMRSDVLNRLGDPAAAAALLKVVVSQRRRYYGSSIALAVDLLYLARLENQLRAPASALAALREAEPMAIEHYGAQTQPVLMIRLAAMTAWATGGNGGKASAIAAGIPANRFDLGKPSVNAIRYLAARVAVARATGQTSAAASDLALARRMIGALGHAADGVKRELAVLD